MGTVLIGWIHHQSINLQHLSKSPSTKKKLKNESRGSAMAAALEALSQAGGVSSIIDPVELQREMRKDCPLPNRDC